MKIDEEGRRELRELVKEMIANYAALIKVEKKVKGEIKEGEEILEKMKRKNSNSTMILVDQK